MMREVLGFSVHSTTAETSAQELTKLTNMKNLKLEEVSGLVKMMTKTPPSKYWNGWHPPVQA
jgi:hypothetical protein